MLIRCFIRFYPSRLQIRRGLLPGVKFIGRTVPCTPRWLPAALSLATGDRPLITFLCSATFATSQRIMLQIKRLASKMPPVLTGTMAAQFAKNKFLLKRRGGQLS
jgi:hypothetical protein